MIGIDATSVSAANSTATWIPVNSAVRRGRTAPFSVRIEGLRVSMRLTAIPNDCCARRRTHRMKGGRSDENPAPPIQVTHFFPRGNSEVHSGADNLAAVTDG